MYSGTLDTGKAVAHMFRESLAMEVRAGSRPASAAMDSSRAPGQASQSSSTSTTQPEVMLEQRERAAVMSRVRWRTRQDGIPSESGPVQSARRREGSL